MAKQIEKTVSGDRRCVSYSCKGRKILKGEPPRAVSPLPLLLSSLYTSRACTSPPNLLIGRLSSWRIGSGTGGWVLPLPIFSNRISPDLFLFLNILSVKRWWSPLSHSSSEKWDPSLGGMLLLYLVFFGPFTLPVTLEAQGPSNIFSGHEGPETINIQGPWVDKNYARHKCLQKHPYQKQRREAHEQLKAG